MMQIKQIAKKGLEGKEEEMMNIGKRIKVPPMGNIRVRFKVRVRLE